MKASNLVALAVLLAVLAAWAAPAPAQPGGKSPVELYTDAKFQEESKGAVDRAIALYRQVWKNTAASASLRAQSLYREGLCQVRKDDFAAARAAFEKLLREFPAAEPAAHAKLMLKTLGASKKGMAAVRDISVEVKEQLIRGTKSSKETRAALKTLVFYGHAARPALREALLMQDRSVQMLALNALAQMGDLQILDRLIAAAGEESFRRTSGFFLSEERALKSLCRAHNAGISRAAISRVAKAYGAAPPGLTKARLMLLLLDLDRDATLNRHDAIADYKSFLQSENAALRSAAWAVHSRLAFGKAGKADEFLADLLKAWNAHPERQSELSSYLFKTGREAVKRDPSLAGPWQKTLLAAAGSKDRKTVEEVARGLGYLDLGHQLPIRSALLLSEDRKVREQAASLRWKSSKPRPDLDAGQLSAFANALVDTAVRYRAREQQHSMTLLNALVQKVVPLLDPAGYAALADRLFTPPVSEIFRVDGPLNPQGALGNTVLQIFQISNLQGAYSHRDRYFSLAEKYVPVLAAYAVPGKPRAVRMRCFQNLGQIVQRAWSFLPKAEQNLVKQAYFAAFDEYRAGKFSEQFSQQLRHYLYNGLIQLAQQHPRVVTVDEVLRHAPLRSIGPRAPRMPKYGTSIFQAFSPQELEEGFVRGAKDSSVRVAPLMELLDYIEIDAEKRDAALRELWGRASGKERGSIARRLAVTDRNLKFLTKAIQPDGNEDELSGIESRLHGWGSRAAAPGLIKLLDARSDIVKCKACGSLGSLADKRAVPKLIELLAYHDSQVRSSAERALTAIRNIDKKQAEWRDWYERHGKKAGRKEAPKPKPANGR